MSNIEMDELLASRIREVVSLVKADSKPEELEKIKKIYKQNVPFSLRGYFTAYLTRELVKENGKKEEKPARRERPQAETRRPQVAESTLRKEGAGSEKKQRVVPEGAKTLYINLGKYGHVYARDLVSLITADGELKKEDIYLIRLHDKYSFITMSEENCQKAIEKLQGKEYRGRTIQINLSNKES